MRPLKPYLYYYRKEINTSFVDILMCIPRYCSIKTKVGDSTNSTIKIELLIDDWSEEITERASYVGGGQVWVERLALPKYDVKGGVTAEVWVREEAFSALPDEVKRIRRKPEQVAAGRILFSRVVGNTSGSDDDIIED